MLFTAELVIPADTPATAPVRQTVDLAVGTITAFSLFFPYKRGAFVGVRLRRFEHQQWPTNPDGWIVGDDEAVAWGEDFDVLEEPFELTLEGYNTDDSFPHTVYLRVAMLEVGREEERAKRGLLGRLAAYLGMK